MFDNLRRKLFVFMLLVSLLPMGLVGVVSFINQENEITTQAERTLVVQSERITNEINRFMGERLNNAAYLARDPVLKDPFIGSSEMEERIGQFLNTHDMYEDVVVVNRQGIVMTDMKSGLRGYDVSDRPWFERVADGETVLSNVYRSPLLGEPVLLLAAPVFDEEGELLRILLPVFDFGTFHSEITAFLEEEENVWETNSVLMDETGTVITHRDEEQILEQNYFEHTALTPSDLEQAANARETLKIEEDNVHAFARVSSFPGFEHDWYVGLSADENEMYAPLTNLLINYLLIFGVVLFLLAAAVYWLSNKLVSPIQQLVHKAGALAHGKRVNEPFRGGYGEINELNYAFDTMAERLQEREQFHKHSTLVLESTDNAVFAFEEHTGKITLWNRRCRELFCVEEPGSLAELAAGSVSFSQLKRLLAGLEDEYPGTNRRMELNLNGNREGEEYLVSLSPLQSPQQNERLVILYDLSDKRKAETEMIRSEKLKVVAQMAAGFAHEVRNPLTTIRGFIQLAHENKSPINDQYYLLVIEEIDRVNKIIHELLDTADPNAPDEKREVDPNQVLQDILTLQQPQLREKGIDWNLLLDPQLPPVYTDKNKLKQIFVNLVQNAVEAMPEGGELIIHTAVEGKQIRLDIGDTGIGMNEEILRKIGTPFFTEKAEGTGLGLTMSYRLVEEMQGKVSVESEPGKGTTFTVLLPLEEDEENTSFF
ncbi:PAS domain-containing sensor histidine kinase [Alkalicoccus halolimnae]|uniref:histidine kinase n=1 Tax=Alkalicoccus halolimnae TaxID=1667239 RepID=A0A5C7FHV2_9BACI|nr:PAS domain-containing sensor histidine kinase [Alkalicoccus halolimnae]TXF86887.1 HAMP domain-containing protein [Alkalicoccus halolimnae]